MKLWNPFAVVILLVGMNTHSFAQDQKKHQTRIPLLSGQAGQYLGSDGKGDPCSPRYVTAVELMRERGIKPEDHNDATATYRKFDTIAKRKNWQLQERYDAECHGGRDTGYECRDLSGLDSEVCFFINEHSLSCTSTTGGASSARCETEIVYTLRSRSYSNSRSSERLRDPDDRISLDIDCEASVELVPKVSGSPLMKMKSATKLHIEDIGYSGRQGMKIEFDIDSEVALSRVDLSTVNCEIVKAEQL